MHKQSRKSLVQSTYVRRLVSISSNSSSSTTKRTCGAMILHTYTNTHRDTQIKYFYPIIRILLTHRWAHVFAIYTFTNSTCTVFTKRNRKSSKIEQAAGKKTKKNILVFRVLSEKEIYRQSKKSRDQDRDRHREERHEQRMFAMRYNDIPWRLHKIHTYFTAEARWKQIKWQSIHKFLLFCV